MVLMPTEQLCRRAVSPLGRLGAGSFTGGEYESLPKISQEDRTGEPRTRPPEALVSLFEESESSF